MDTKVSMSILFVVQPPSDHASLKPIVTTNPHELVWIGVLEMGPMPESNRYILSVADYLMKFGGVYG